MKRRPTRTMWRKLKSQARVPRTPSLFTGTTCPACHHYTRVVRVHGHVQRICNADPTHRSSQVAT
jgi:hypothetical protein